MASESDVRTLIEQIPELPDEVKEDLARGLLLDGGPTYLRVEYGRGQLFARVLTPEEVKNLKHCATCRCWTLHPEMPSHPAHPEIKRTKSWHHG